MIATLNGNGHAKRLPQGILLDADGQVIADTARDVVARFAPQLYFGSGTGYGQYGANVTKNSLAGWLWRGGDADADIGSNVQTLRERSRDAFMGIPLASAAVETYDTNVIGEGLFPAPNVDGEALGLDEQETADLNHELATKFGWWASDPRECDFEAKHSFTTLQSVAFKSMLLSGDCPVLFPLTQRPFTLFDLRLRILEADRIMNPLLVRPTDNIYSGVELSLDGELLAYHINSMHPLSQWRAFGIRPRLPISVRVEPFGKLTGRRNMILLIKPERPEQRRGVPILSVCLELLKQHGRFIDSTVVAAVIQSYFTAFITSEFPDPNLFESLLTDAQKAEVLNFNPYNVQLGPGIVNFMRPGHAVNFASPTQPLSNFGDFTIAVAKFVGAAIGMPYEVLLKQFNASYSASRAALLDFWKRVRKYRAQMIDQFCQPTYEEWLTDAILLGRIENFKGGFDDPFVRRAMLRCIWTGSSAGSLDPQKEVTAADLKVKCGFSTIERESAELNGSNYRDNITQQAVEANEFEEADLTYPPYRPTMIGSSPVLLPGQEKPAPKPPPVPPGAPPQKQLPPPPPKSARRKRSRGTEHAVLASGLSGRFMR
jgi:lambda family phage portal protein